MAAVLDIDLSLFVQHRPDIVILLRHQGKGTEYIQPRHRLRGSLNSFDFSRYPVPDFTEQIIFQRAELILRI